MACGLAEKLRSAWCEDPNTIKKQIRQSTPQTLSLWGFLYLNLLSFEACLRGRMGGRAAFIKGQAVIHMSVLRAPFLALYSTRSVVLSGFLWARKPSDIQSG